MDNSTMGKRNVTSWDWNHVRLLKAKGARQLLNELRKNSNDHLNHLIVGIIQPLSDEEALRLPNVVQVSDAGHLDVDLHTRKAKIDWLIARYESNFEKQWQEKVGWPYQDVFDPFKFQRHIDDMRIVKAAEAGVEAPERTIPAEGEKWEAPKQADADDEDEDEYEDPRAQQSGAANPQDGEKVAEFAQSSPNRHGKKLGVAGLALIAGALGAGL